MESGAVRLFIIQLEGEFDITERPHLIDAFAIAQDTPIIVVNLERCDYIDSSVLECLVALHAACGKRGGQLLLVGPHGAVRRLFEITQLNRLFDIRDRLDAVGDLEGGRVRRLTIESRPTPEG